MAFTLQDIVSNVVYIISYMTNVFQCGMFILYRTKVFPRWMHGTCIECPPQKVEGDDEPYVFSFFTDISVDPVIIELVQLIQTNIKKTLTELTKYLQRWKKFRQIWISDKVCFMDLFHCIINIWYVQTCSWF